MHLSVELWILESACYWKVQLTLQVTFCLLSITVICATIFPVCDFRYLGDFGFLSISNRKRFLETKLDHSAFRFTFVGCSINFWPLRSFVDIFHSIWNHFKLLCVLQCVQNKVDTFSMLFVLFADFLELIFEAVRCKLNVKEFDCYNAVST